MAVPAGSIRFNTDSAKMEIYNGDKWWEIDSTSPQEQTGGTRGLWGAGGTPASPEDRIEYVNIDTIGDWADFGDLTVARAANPGAGASRTRAYWAGGQTSPGYHNVIDYVTISSTGDAQDFGDMQSQRRAPMSASNEIRGVILAGTQSGTTLNLNDYITIATTGNAQDFADVVTTCTTTNGGCMASPTRGVFAGGYGQPSSSQSTINYITFMTQGKQADFGDISTGNRYGNEGCSNAIRGLWGGGVLSPAFLNVIEYITIATQGNSKDFGDLSGIRSYGSAMASSTRGVWAGGYTEPSPATKLNICEYVNFATTGNAIDFGDITGLYSAMTGTSNGHGGLG